MPTSGLTCLHKLKILGIKLRAESMLGKHSTVGPAPGPNQSDFKSAGHDLCSLIRGSGGSKSQNRYLSANAQTFQF